MRRAKREEIIEIFAEAAGERFPLVVRRGGNARQRDVFLDGKVRLNWFSNGDSEPIPVPQGIHRLHCIAIGSLGETYGFSLVSPHEEPLGAGRLTNLGGDAFDREVEIP